ncbi:glycosyltransferase [Geitlerinema sp. PCC 9228]|jgi:glycosyltransferase involved in cell wall biosynthesis|uniref:glycosyltransferase n=1 Tax=Geitlerinema sp. PCC 9228 TaxID=111611 RepID=UPI0008F9E11C|nr:glycosyltransferase [Geitlerinema sp. PCC 9228]
MPNPNSCRKYVILAPNLFEYQGGEQVYNAFLLQTLQSIDPQASYEVFLESDRFIERYSQFLPNTYFRGFGHLPRWWRSIDFVWQIFWLCWWQPPRLIIATHMRYGFLCGLLQICFQVQYWLVARGWERWHCYRWCQRLALGQAACILATSYYMRSRLLQLPYLHPNRTIVVPHLVDGNQFRIAEKPKSLQQRYSLQPRQPVVLTVSDSKTSNRDGYEQILQAIALLRQDLPNVRYIFVGPAEDIQRVNRMARKFGIRENVTLVFCYSTKELSLHYNLCDIVALPSIAGNSSLVCLEALACGKPVLVGDRDGATDLVAGGRLGCLVDPENPQAIASCLQLYLQKAYPNPMLYQPHQLRSRVLERFGGHRFRQTLKNLVLAIPAAQPALKKLKFE